jgi:hypothetical protein
MVLPPERQGARAMVAPDEYRAFATECFQWAEEAKTEEQRKAFLGMARAWTLAAMRLEGVLIPDTGHGLSSVPPPMEGAP